MPHKKNVGITFFYPALWQRRTTLKGKEIKNIILRKHKSLLPYMSLLKKQSSTYSCSPCVFTCTKLCDWNRHKFTTKHVRRTTAENKVTRPPIANAAETSALVGTLAGHAPGDGKGPFVCSTCHKSYKARNSFWYHRKRCNVELTPTSLTHIVLDMVRSQQDLQKQNQQFQTQNDFLQQQVIEICKTMKSSLTINQTMTNSHNKTFNLNFFLNEQCKNAMNISEFVDSFQLQLADLEQVGDLGYVNGLTNVIVKRLQEMDIYRRPIHCSDQKRDVMHVKDNNIWEKDSGDEHSKVRLAVQAISNKNTKQLLKWREKYPQSAIIESKYNDQFLLLVVEAMGGKGNKTENENKIMHHIAKEVFITKEQWLVVQ